MIMKRLLALLLAGILAASALSACGSSTTEKSDETEAPTKAAESATEKTATEAPTEAPTEIRNNNGDPFYGEDNITLTVWAGEELQELTKKMCSDFIAKYPDKKITINVAVHEEGDIDYEFTTNPSSCADVFSVGCDQLNLIKEKVAPVVSDYWEDVTVYHSEQSVATATVDGKLMAYPETEPYSYYLVYDKNCVSDTDARTLEGVLEACRRSGKKFVIDASNGYYGCMFPFTGGLSVEGVDDEGLQLFNQYDKDKVLDSMEAFSELFNEYSDVIQNNNNSLISTGMIIEPTTVAAGIDGYWMVQPMQEQLGNRYGAAKLPTININGNDTQMISMAGSKVLAVNAKSKFPESAQVLADYLAGYDCQNQRLAQFNWIPSIKELQSSDVLTRDAGLSALLEQSKYCVLQSNVSLSFWEPMGNLSATVARGDSDRATLKSQFDRMINDIKSE